MSIRVVIADDHNIVRQGIRMMLETKADIEVVGEAKDGQECVDLVADSRPDVVLLDISMPAVDGLTAASILGEKFPGVKVLALTMHDEAEYVLQAIRAGAVGYLVKGADPEELVVAVKKVAGGEAYLHSQVAEHVMAGLRSQGGTRPNSTSLLTDREREVLKLISEGLTGREVADQLYISLHTVERHRANIMNKLDVHNKAELIRRAIKKGLVELDG